MNAENKLSKFAQKHIDKFINIYQQPLGAQAGKIEVVKAFIDGSNVVSFCKLKGEPNCLYKLDCNLTTKEGGITLYKEAGFTELTVSTEDV